MRMSEFETIKLYWGERANKKCRIFKDPKDDD